MTRQKPTPLPEAEVQQFVKSHPDWSTAKGPLTRTWELTTFPEAMRFVARIGELAEAADHHPDIDIRWRKVTLAFITHDAGNAITALDTKLAGEAELIARSMK